MHGQHRALRQAYKAARAAAKLVLQIGAAAQSVPFARFTVSAVSQDQVELQGADFVHNITEPMPQHIMTATATHLPGCAYGCRRLHMQEE